MVIARVRSFVCHPLPWVVSIYLAGVAIRAHYTLIVHPPAKFVYSDMNLYVSLAKRLADGTNALQRWDITHPLGYPWLLGTLIRWDPTMERAAQVHLAVGVLVPLAVGLLGLSAFGRRTAYAATVFASLYFPFIEFGGMFLSEIHFIFSLTLAFAALFAARRARTMAGVVVLSLTAGLVLSLATALKSVALPAAVSFFAAEFVALPFRRESPRERLRRAATWLLRGVLVVLATLPLLGFLARICTTANQGKFCVTGNKIGADFLLGHYGRIGSIHWGADEGRVFAFGSPGAYLRHYTAVEKVPFPLTDSEANFKAAWTWVRDNPFESVVLSLDHVYDAFFGVAAWPTYATQSWAYAHLSQYAFVLFLFVPTVLAINEVARRGFREFITSRVVLALAPLAALAATVMMATGEVRYRIPFDVFFIVVSCAYVFADSKFMPAGDKAPISGFGSLLPSKPVTPAPAFAAPGGLFGLGADESLGLSRAPAEDATISIDSHDLARTDSEPGRLFRAEPVHAVGVIEPNDLLFAEDLTAEAIEITSLDDDEAVDPGKRIP